MGNAAKKAKLTTSVTIVPAKIALFNAKASLIEHASYYWSIIHLITRL